MTKPVDALWTRVICKQPGRYIGWPTITRTRAGELLAVFSGDREEHVCPWGKTHLVRSSDDGVRIKRVNTVICPHPVCRKSSLCRVANSSSFTDP